MTSASAFVGSVPENYDQHLGPMYFRPYAIDIAKRAAKYSPPTILETAAGTGISTDEIAKANPQASLTVTDLNPSMMDIAQARPGIKAEWIPADAQALPFEDNQFDMVIAQYGVMFYPDKEAAFREAYRVLKPGGVFLFNAWDSLADNDVARAVGEVITKHNPTDTPPFLKTPFGFSDPSTFMGLGKEAGFETSEPETVTLACDSVSAESAAKGLVLGTPLNSQLLEREMDANAVLSECASLIGERYGYAPMHCKMQAKVYEFKKPV